MAGITDMPFRQLCREFGAGMVVGEMTSSDKTLHHTVKSRLRQAQLIEIEPRSVQIVGWDPAMMAESARFCVEQGASVVDINMGCPAKKVCRKLAGSALLSDEKQVGKILDAVVGAVEVPVTLKIRTGTDPTLRNGVTIAKIAEAAGISMLAVHGRTRACKFGGDAEYRTIRSIKRAVSIPVLANGDLNSALKIIDVLSFTKADGVMIGRRAQGAPWFPGQVADYLDTGTLAAEPDLETQRCAVIRHLDGLYRYYGPDQGVRIARKHIKWYVEKFPGNVCFRQRINPVATPGKQIKLVSDFYKKQQDTKTAA